VTSTKVPRAYRAAVGQVPQGVLAGQTVADVPPDGEQLLFLIGMRVNRWRRVRSWWPVAAAMPRMLRELAKDPEVGLVSAEGYWSGRVFLVVQHWRSAEHLGRFARDPGMAHAPAWAEFNRAVAGTGDVGIFHETYRVPASGIESIYGNMPPLGLGRALGVVERSRGQRTATHEQMGSTEPDYVTPAAAG
jgi:hypothetical protein